MNTYILTELLGGDYSNHLSIHRVFQTEKKARAERDRIINARCARPLFGSFNPDDSISVAQYREDQEHNLQVWKKVC